MRNWSLCLLSAEANVTTLETLLEIRAVYLYYMREQFLYGGLFWSPGKLAAGLC
jgi:hypothetical protein